jgi:hypothetical protein
LKGEFCLEQEWIKAASEKGGGVLFAFYFSFSLLFIVYVLLFLSFLWKRGLKREEGGVEWVSHLFKVECLGSLLDFERDTHCDCLGEDEREREEEIGREKKRETEREKREVGGAWYGMLEKKRVSGRENASLVVL